MENKMGTMPMKKLLATMSLPIMLSMLIQACYNIVDSMFVARYSQDALAAVSLAFPIQMLIISAATDKLGQLLMSGTMTYLFANMLLNSKLQGVFSSMLIIPLVDRKSVV